MKCSFHDYDGINRLNTRWNDPHAPSGGHSRKALLSREGPIVPVRFLQTEKLYHFRRKDTFSNLLYSSGPPGKKPAKERANRDWTSRRPGRFQSVLYKTPLDVDIIIENPYEIDSARIMNFQAAGIATDKFRLTGRNIRRQAKIIAHNETRVKF